MVISGIYLGIARATYERFSVKWAHHLILVYLLEILFWLLQTIIIFTVLYYVNYGEIRFYLFLAILLGYSIYMVCIHSWYKRLLEGCIKVLHFFLRFLKNFIWIVIIRPIQFIMSIVFTIGSFILSIVKGILKKMNFWPISKLKKIFNGFFNKIKGFYSTIKNKFKKEDDD